MPYRLEFTEDSGFIAFYSGVLTDELAIECQLAKRHDERTLTIQYAINDFSEVTDFELTVEALRTIAHYNLKTAKMNPDIYAIAIMPTDLGYAISIQWQGFAPDDETGWETATVKTRQEAIDLIQSKLNIDCSKYFAD